ncbi:hypothetical protein LSH36_52g09055 [Paralvinella palmiformis]|uniref:DALR anticodon binding domain-containing protein n=1 Tax=Paralvinella palmiformis TaxID=53620 RepID=A0AAD9K611_9ANNE|nr:hypothetical protein LSH36_52g09055 [Paralvinella palmiformis]
MALRSREKFIDVLQYCQTGIASDLRNVLNFSLDGDDIVILKRNKCLKNGDFLGVVRKWKTNRAKTIGGLSFKSIHPFHASVLAVTQEHDIALTLDRKQIYFTAILEVLNHGQEYGQVSGSPTNTKQNACINVDYLFDNSDWATFSVSHLRSLLLSEHVAALLNATGCQVKYIQHVIHDQLKKSMNDYGISSETYKATQDENNEQQLVALKEEIHEILCGSGYLEDIPQAEGKNTNVDQSGTMSKLLREEKSPVLINLRRFLSENDLLDQFDRIINIVEFTEGNARLHKLTVLVHHMKSIKQVYDFLVHIVPQERSFCSQTVDIGVKIIEKLNKHSVKQIHIVHGSVSHQLGKKQILKAGDLLSHRIQEMRRASFMKYGDNIQGEFFAFFLECVLNNELNLDMSQLDETQTNMDRRGGVFVMYNYARLSNLFRKFETAVHEGFYQPLPDVSTLDFSLLREEQEWELMFNYVLVYPSLVQNCIEMLRNNKSKAVIHTHKVCQFLQDLSRALSSYYSHFHVLGEPHDHLLPVMYCRIYLLKSIQQVMHNALSLLSITPISLM